MEYQMEHSNECKKNFVAVYDGSSAIENLKAKFCSTVANDVMLDNGVGVVRMWADEKSRLSRFRMLFTSFVDRECRFFLLNSVFQPCSIVFFFVVISFLSASLGLTILICLAWFTFTVARYKECGPKFHRDALSFIQTHPQTELDQITHPCFSFV